MKINFIKQAGGMLLPANDIEEERMARFKTGQLYEIEIKESRNGSFHRKVFSFMNYCFQFWCADRAGLGEMNQHAQFEAFRKQMTISAGYYDIVAMVNGGQTVEAKSLSYSSMSQEDFEHYYSALINAALKHIFGNTQDQDVINQLYSFF